MAVNTAMERSTIAPTPTATRSTCVYAPAALPSTVTNAARRPCDTARLTTNITLGPGMMMIANATAANPTSDEVGGTLVLKPLKRPNRRAISTAEGHVQFRSQRAVLPQIGRHGEEIQTDPRVPPCRGRARPTRGGPGP